MTPRVGAPPFVQFRPWRRVWLAAALIALVFAVGGAAAREAVERGKYLFRAAGGCSCHTDVKRGGAFLAGGRALETPFGTFYSPNITPDSETGIGGWSIADFTRAMRDGVAPDGGHYFPAFPYTAFTGIADVDLADMKAYLDTVPPVRRRNTPHDVRPPFAWRFMLAPWKWLFFERGPFRPDPERPASWNRGAYLATALAHCGECHTPRNFLGGLDGGLWFAGTGNGPEGRRVPNITPDVATGIGRWSARDVMDLLETGFKPDFDNIQGPMAEAIEHGYKYLSESDRAAIAEYVLTRPPIENRVAPERRQASPYE
ncbi:MAG: cytochrome c [Alphaproteobacteria bacterium]